MKESNISWLGKIPNDWETERFKYLFSEIVEKNHEDEPLLVASQNMGVVPKNVYGLRTVEATKDLNLLKFVKVGDFVISLRSFQGGIEYAYYQGIISPAYTILRTKGKIQNEYFKWLAKSYIFIKVLQTCVTGIREGQNIDYSMLKENFMPIPPKENQLKIANFLDVHCSQIDTFIEKKTKEIELLEELKKSVITEAVLGRLDKNRKLKNSGIRWIGKIPENWNVKRIKYLFKIRDERSYEALEDVNLISVYSDKGVLQRADLECATGNKATNADGYKKVYQDDVVVNIMLCWMGAIGVSEYEGVTSPAYDVYKARDNKLVYGKYINYLFRTKQFGDECYLRGRGILITRWRVYSDQFSDIKIPLPSYDEQVRIGDFIHKKCLEIDTMISNIQKEIDSIQDLRKRLICDAVTGKLTV